MTSPLIPKVGVLGLVPDEWSDTWQPRHQVLSRLAEYFHVIWLNPPRSRKKPQNGSRPPVRVFAQNSPGFAVYKPEFWLPVLHRPKWLGDATSYMRLRRAHRLLQQKGVEKVILYLWRHHFDRALDAVPYDFSCYHIDDEYSFSPVEKPLDHSEVQLIARVDHVFIHSQGLLERKGGINPHTTFVPNGVDYEAYATQASEPPDLAVIPRPRVGYTGFLKKQLDWPLMLQLATRHPGWSFVFVGPEAPHSEIREFIGQMSQKPNVHFLGRKPTHELAMYPQHFDACIMPYRLDDYTKYIYPLKLHEYLASGRPVVGTPIRSLLEFSQFVQLPRTVEEWSDALSRCMATSVNSLSAAESRREIARQHDWDTLVKRIAVTMCEGLGPDYAAMMR